MTAAGFHSQCCSGERHPESDPALDHRRAAGAPLRVSSLLDRAQPTRPTIPVDQSLDSSRSRRSLRTRADVRPDSRRRSVLRFSPLVKASTNRLARRQLHRRCRPRRPSTKQSPQATAPCFTNCFINTTIPQTTDLWPRRQHWPFLRSPTPWRVVIPTTPRSESVSQNC